MKNILILLAAVLSSGLSYAQQEPHYTQNQFNSNLLLNPAYAGSGPCASVGLRYRNQWTGFNGAPVTFSGIGDTRIASDRLGIGFTINYDKIGIERILTPDLNVSYHIPVSETGKLAVGFKGGASFLTADYNSLTGVNMADPLYTGSAKITIPFIGLGALYYTDKSYVGLSVPRMVSFENPAARTKVSKPHYYLYGGHRFVFKNGLDLRPALLARFESEAPLQFDFAADLWYENVIGFGVSYRTGDAIDFMLKGKIKQLYLGYSYDMTVSGLSNFNHGTHEFFVGYEFCTGETKNYPRTDNIRHF
jgi:type IX secretion system PorP/SprF family membrane protein